MVALKTIALGAVIGIGAGIGGYAMHRPDVKECTGVYEQNPAAMSTALRDAYSREVAKVDALFKDIPSNPRVVAAREMTIEYTVSKEAGLKAPVITFTPTGLQGVLAKEDLYGTTTLYFHPLGAGKVQSAEAKTAMIPSVKVY